MENNDIANKSLPIGTVVTFADGHKVKVVEKYDGCYNCCFLGNDGCNVTNHIRKIIGDCSETKRKDNTDVVFIPLTGGLSETVTDEGGHGTNITGTIDNTKEGTLQSTVPTTTQIVIPAGYEIDVDNCDLVKGIIKFKKKYITLNDVYNNLEHNKKRKYKESINGIGYWEYMLAFANLLDIAQYYNADWKFTPNGKEYGYYIYRDNKFDRYCVSADLLLICNFVHFKNKEDAQAVIDNPNFKDILNIVYGNKN